MSSGGTVPPSPVIPFSAAQFPSNTLAISSFFDSNPFSIDSINGNKEVKAEKRAEEQNGYQDSEFDSSDEIMAAEEPRDPLSAVDSPSVEVENSIVEQLKGASSVVVSETTENRHSNNSAMSTGSSSRRKRFHPQRQPVILDHTPAEVDDQPPPMLDSRFDREVLEPKKEENDVDEDELYELEDNRSSADFSPFPGSTQNGSSPMPAGLGESSSLATHLNANSNSNMPPQANPNKLRELFEFQQRMYAAFNQQQQRQQQQRASSSSQAADSEEAKALQGAVMQLFLQFTQSLKDEVGNVLKKLENESYAAEIEKMSVQHVNQAQHMRQQKEQQAQQEWRQQQARMAAAAFGMPPNMASGGPLFNSLNVPPYGPNPNSLMALAAANQQNPLNSLANSLSNAGGSATLTNSNPMALGGGNTNGASKMANGSTSGIFPTTLPNFPPFNGFVNHPLGGGSIRSDDGSPRKKRAKVTDSVRGPRASAVRDSGHSLPTSNRSSPQPSSYFPPTMVAHPLFNNANFKLDNGGRSPGNSDISDYEGDNSFIRYSVRAPISSLHHRLSGSFNSMLTHVHLRKAKLMFFYTRYPNSAVLKTYFPDINFNKNNTAQLVKWFSNFREFYYMQMEKYAKQALAEGITDANDITVTTDSEIFRTLNQHYNRNNFISPPDSLAGVIEETLKEFFRALRDGRDSEPSWKKAIYKVIQQLDEQIPDFFKTQQFMTQLEGNPQP